MVNLKIKTWLEEISVFHRWYDDTIGRYYDRKPNPKKQVKVDCETAKETKIKDEEKTAAFYRQSLM